MPASETSLPLRIGARTLFTLRRRLVRRGLSLEEALGGGAAGAAARWPRASTAIWSPPCRRRWPGAWPRAMPG